MEEVGLGFKDKMEEVGLGFYQKAHGLRGSLTWIKRPQRN
jgi:hypothetical protein